jgi:aspartyl-tRNA(Asn)/glutamyl-tRNA(Gln) amidotransferase subunit A
MLLQASSSDLSRSSITEAAGLLRRKKLSPVELTEACLARIERLNPTLNAFITVTGPEALKQARIAEKEIRKGAWRGPLHGVPVALKDLIDTAGVRTTAGSALFKDRVPQEDAEVVQRLKAAGAVLLGKLNMHEFAYGDTSLNATFGAVGNPWNRDRVAGGSSGGSAAAVAAGLCYGALGSDTGGSIRQPAAYCGITGLKPTYGRVSTRGAIPLAWSLDHIGPMCRSAHDAAVFLQAIAGYDPLDLTSVDAPVTDYTPSNSKAVFRFRLGIPRAVFFEGLDPEIESAVQKAIQTLRGLTSSLDEVQLPDFEVALTSAEAYTYHAQWITKTPELYEATTRGRIEPGAKMSAETYIKMRRDLERVRRAITGTFTKVDLLITPTTPTLPPTVDDARAKAGGSTISLRNTRRFNAYGLPTISIPCGFTSAGLPVGLSISGPHFGESSVLALADAYQRATDWHLRKPPV